MRDEVLEFAIQYLAKKPLSPAANLEELERTRSAIGDRIFETYLKELASPDFMHFGGRNFREWAADFIENMNGNYGQDRILRRVIARFIEDDEVLPPELREYFKRDPIPKPVKNKRGPDPRQRGLRNAAITSCVSELRSRYGLAPTRNLASRSKEDHDSACSKVTKALDFLGMAISEDAVQKIWKNGTQGIF